MSLTSKITFGLSCAFSVSIISYVHIKQNRDKERLHQGVIKDIENQQRRKIMNTLELQRQQDLKVHLQKMLEPERSDNEVTQ